MKKMQDERGNIVRVFEEGDGMRRRFYDALEETRFSYPRKRATHHSLSWYCDGHLASRPVSGIWTCSNLAEHLLALSKDAKRTDRVPGLQDAVRYFASTRRAMRLILSHYKVRTRLTRLGVANARLIYGRLCKEGQILLRSCGLLTPTTAL